MDSYEDDAPHTLGSDAYDVVPRQARLQNVGPSYQQPPLHQEARADFEQMEAVRRAFFAGEEIERNDPRNIQVRFMYINTSEDAASRQLRQTEKLLYSIFIDGKATIHDLKVKIGKEFGFNVEAIQIHFRYKLIKDMVYIREISGIALDVDILLCITLGDPQIPFRNVIRQPLAGIRLNDIRTMNCKTGVRRNPTRKETYLYGRNFERFNIDEQKISEPVYIDFSSTVNRISKEYTGIMQRLPEIIATIYKQDFLNQTQAINDLAEFQRLVELETEFNYLYTEFVDAALYAVHFIIKNETPDINIDNLMGDEGSKFMVGGLFVRRAKSWMVCGKILDEKEPRIIKGSAGAHIDVNQVVNKIATLDVRTLAILRHRIPGLSIPLACIIDYYGLLFEV